MHGNRTKRSDRSITHGGRICKRRVRRAVIDKSKHLYYTYHEHFDESSRILYGEKHMKPNNICLISDSFPPSIDGVANAVLNYARVLSSLGKASVIAPFYPDADDSGFGFPVLRFPSLDTTEQVGYRAGVPLSPVLMEEVENAGFDLIHSHCPMVATILARMIRSNIHRPIVMTYHTKYDIDIANAIRGKLIQQEAIRLLVSNMSACDEIWTVSRGAGENLRKIGYTGEYIVMPNGVDLPRGGVDGQKIFDATKDYDLPQGVPLFLFVGRMMWYKGIRLILDALKGLAGAGQPFRMVFLGGGGDLEEIREYTRGLGLDGQVIFVPATRDRETIRAWYCRADLLLFPSTFDTNGLVVREAAACALATVLVAGSCAAEDVEDGVSGFLIEENAVSMEALLRKLCAAPQIPKQVGENAQRLLYLSWDDAVKRAVDRYGTVTENYRLGRYPDRDRFGDEVLNITARTINTINQIRNLTKKSGE